MSTTPPRPSSSPATPPPAPKLDERGMPVGATLNGEWELSPRQVRDQMAGGGVEIRPLLLDCRRPDEHAFASIPGDTHVPMDEIPGRLEELADLAGERPVIVYCHHGVRSMRVTGLLRQAGFANVMSMAGGIDLWSTAVDPTTPRY